MKAFSDEHQQLKQVQGQQQRQQQQVASCQGLPSL
jgi:hypothetical protein